jgi:hypothetical protein
MVSTRLVSAVASCNFRNIYELFSVITAQKGQLRVSERKFPSEMPIFET